MILALKNTKYMALLLFASLSLSACEKEKNSRPSSSEAVTARVEQPRLRMVTQWQEFTGRFQAMNRVDIRARVSGYLQDIKFKDGQIVKKGDVLFVVDQRPFKISLQRE